jgi:hypothetical protein
MALEIVFMIAGDEPQVLGDVAEAVPDAEVEYHSGLGGLEIVGTLAVPTLALAFQIIQTVVALSQTKNPSTKIVNIHVYNGSQQTIITDCSDVSVVKKALEKIQ